MTEYIAVQSADPHGRGHVTRALVAGQLIAGQFAPIVSDADAPALIPAEKIAARREKAIATTTKRSFTLIADGYVFEPQHDRSLLFFCRKPAPDRDKDGVITCEGYWIDLAADSPHGGKGICGCPMFGYGRGKCKHVLNLLAKLAEYVALFGPSLPTPVAIIPPASASVFVVYELEARRGGKVIAELEVARFDTEKAAREFVHNEESLPLATPPRFAIWTEGGA